MDVATGVIEAVSASESASLHGHRALTPIISGAISGGLVGLAWLIGFIIYFYKRHRREQRARALGFRSHREMLDPPKKKEAFIIPPDPAIVEAGHQPGENFYDDPKVLGDLLPRHAHTVPVKHIERALGRNGEKGKGIGNGEDAEERARGLGLGHAASAPSRVPQAHASDAPHASATHTAPAGR